MENRHKIKKWIENVILSCNTWDQVTTCEKMIQNFKNQMKKEGYDEMLALPFIIDLKYKIDLKRKNLIENNPLTLN